MPPKKGGTKRTKKDRPTSEEDAEVSFHFKLSSIYILCSVYIAYLKILFNCLQKQDDGGSKEQDEDKDGEPAAKKSKHPARFVEAGLWRVKDAIYRVSVNFNLVNIHFRRVN